MKRETEGGRCREKRRRRERNVEWERGEKEENDQQKK